jgi:hypothetical protein
MEIEDRLVKKIKTIYSEIIRRLVDPSFSFPEGGQPTRQITQFIEKFTLVCGGTLNTERLVYYCIFQCHKNRNAPYQKRLAPNTFGATALKKYQQMASKEKRYMEDQWLASASLTRSYLNSLICKKEHPLSKYVFMRSEEATKKRSINTDLGFALCYTSTLMYSPFSPSCQSCTNSEKCKVETQKRYPELYRLRIERYGEEGR